MKSINLGTMMKRLFVAFLVVGAFLMSVEAWGADEKNQGNPMEMVQKNRGFIVNTYNEMISLAQKVTQNIAGSAYTTISRIFNNVISVLLGLIAFFWLFKHLKTGTISREEAFKAIVWVITFVIVYALLNSRGAFTEFTSIFEIPQHLVSAALNTEGGNAATRLDKAFMKPYLMTYEIAPQSLKFYLEKASFWEKVGAVLMGIFSGGILTLVYGVFIIMCIILIVAIIIIQMYSIFLTGIYKAFLPIMIPLLLIPQTRNIFFAWVKSFIGITMYVPLSMIPVSILQSSTNLITAQDDVVLVPNIPFYTLCGIVACVIGILLLYKIPTWISELLGVANQGVGMGGAMGMLKTAGMGLGGIGKMAIGNILDSKSIKGGIARTIANVATGGASAAVEKIAKGGFTAMANFFKKSKE